MAYEVKRANCNAETDTSSICVTFSQWAMVQNTHFSHFALRKNEIFGGISARSSSGPAHSLTHSRAERGWDGKQGELIRGLLCCFTYRTHDDDDRPTDRPTEVTVSAFRPFFHPLAPSRKWAKKCDSNEIETKLSSVLQFPRVLLLLHMLRR